MPPAVYFHRFQRSGERQPHGLTLSTRAGPPAKDFILFVLHLLVVFDQLSIITCLGKYRTIGWWFHGHMQNVPLILTCSDSLSVLRMKP